MWYVKFIPWYLPCTNFFSLKARLTAAGPGPDLVQNGLSSANDHDSVRAMFEAGGRRRITTVQLPRSQLTRSFKGVAVVVFQNPEHAEATCEEYKGRKDGISVVMKYARKHSPNRSNQA